MSSQADEMTLELIYAEYGVCMHHSLFAGHVIDKMARALLEAHKNGYVKSPPSTPKDEFPPEYEEFQKMLRIGLPKEVVAARMRSASLDPTKLLPDTACHTEAGGAHLQGIMNIGDKALRSSFKSENVCLHGPFAENEKFKELMKRRYAASQEAKAISQELAALEREIGFKKEGTVPSTPLELMLERLECVRPPSPSGEHSDSWLSD